MEKCDICGKETPIMQLGVRYCFKCGESVIRVCQQCGVHPFYCKSCKSKNKKKRKPIVTFDDVKRNYDLYLEQMGEKRKKGEPRKGWREDKDPNCIGKDGEPKARRHRDAKLRAQARRANNKSMVKLEIIPRELLPLAKEAMKYKSAEEFADKAIILDGVLSKDFPINKINNLNTKHSIAELKDAKSEILDGTYKHWSREPIRLFYDAGNGSYSIIDGFHRLTRALISGKETIAATLEFSGNKRQLIKFYNNVKRKK